MCGIAGIYGYGPSAAKPSLPELEAISAHMRRRGPDAAGSWQSADERVILGHRRLSIIDLSEMGQQPMCSIDDRYVLTFNGEIYNYKELKASLEAEGYRFRSSSDSEVLLNLYARYGFDMLPKLRGMFAFALWDKPRRGLFLARDGYGIKPLYYSDDGSSLRFASQVKALLAGKPDLATVDPAGLVGFHLFGHVPEPFTFYSSIRSLPAGTSLWVDDRGSRPPTRYENLSAIFAGAHGPVSTGDLYDIVRKAALDSVRAHLVADVEVGAFLSGGIDSGALVGLMRDAGQTAIRTITLSYPEFSGTEDDETELAQRIAKLYHTEHTTREVTKREFEADLPLILDAMDQPSIDGVNTWFVSKAASELGLKVALSGVGGDELLGGYSTFHDVPRWKTWLGPVSRIQFAGPLADAVINRLYPSLLLKNPKVAGILRYTGSWEGAYFLKRAVVLPSELPSFLDPAVVTEGLEKLHPLGMIAASMQPDPGTNFGRVSVLESANYMKNQLLRDTDWAGMAHSLEVRTPLVDTFLTRELAGLLTKFKPGAAKLALGHAPSTPLPREITHRVKTGFGVPLSAWLGDAPEQSGRTVSRRWARTVARHPW